MYIFYHFYFVPFLFYKYQVPNDDKTNSSGCRQLKNYRTNQRYMAVSYKQNRQRKKWVERKCSLAWVQSGTNP